MNRRNILLITILIFGWATLFAGGEILNGAPVALNKAEKWCVSPMGPLPNWDTPAHPECKMVWRVLAERNGRTLYSARHAWPSRSSRSAEPLRVLTEVLYEGTPGSRVVHRLYAVQEDEARLHLEPLRVVTNGTATIIESKVCMTGTKECGREIFTWSNGAVEPIDDRTVAEIRSRLPKGYDIKINPEIDLHSMSGSGKAWKHGDGDCCPSAAIEFTLRLDAGELHIEELKFQRPPA
jgi:hypothetical protein